MNKDLTHQKTNNSVCYLLAITPCPESPTHPDTEQAAGVWVLLTCPSRSPITDLEPSLLEKKKSNSNSR